MKALLLAEPKLTLAVAESLTAGNVQAQIAGISGASGYFLGGVTAYSIEEKVRLLGVNRAGAKKLTVSRRGWPRKWHGGGGSIWRRSGGGDDGVCGAECSGRGGVADGVVGDRAPAGPRRGDDS